MASQPGTVWRKIQTQFGAPPQWVPVGSFFTGVKGDKGEAGKQGQPGQSVIGPPGLSLLPRGFIDGFILSNDGTFTDFIDISAGMAADSTNSVALTNSSTFIKSTTGAWVAGSGSNGLFTGSSIPTSTVLHAFVIARPGGVSFDAGFDTSITAANIPSGYTLYRRIGSVLTDSQPHVRLFHQYGDEFWYDTSLLDVDVTNPGTSAVTRTLTNPTGLKVQSIISTVCFSSSLNIQSYVSSLDSADIAVSFTTAVEDAAGDTTIEGVGGKMYVWTNTSAQIRSRLSQSDGNTKFRIRTLGWVDQRGKNS